MALWLIDSDDNRYDFLQANIPSGFPVDVRRRIIDLAFSHGAKDIGDQKVRTRELKISSFMVGTTGGFMRMIHDCGDNDLVTDWNEQADDALTPVQDTTHVKQGTNSMKLGVDASKGGTDQAWWTHVGPWDFEDYTADWVYVWVYIETVAFLLAAGTAFSIWLGSDATHVYKWNFTKAELAVGWNQLKLDMSSPDTSVGTPDWANLDYNWIGIICIIGNTDDFSVYVDDMKFWRISYQAEFDDLMRQIGKQDFKFYKDTARYINVKNMRLSSHRFIVGDAKAGAEVTLFCNDPFFYKDSLTTETAWAVTASPDTNSYFNEGNIDVGPGIEITANADLGSGIELKNQSDGDVLFTYEDTAFTAAKVLTVDCLNGTVDLDGTNTLRFFSGQFLRLLAGMNTFEYTGGDCSIVFTHRDRWL